MEAQEFYLAKPWLKHYQNQMPHDIEIPNQPIGVLLEQSMLKNGAKTALIYYGRKVSYRLLREQVNSFAASLNNLGCIKGTRVAIYLNNCPQLIIAYCAAIKIGAIVTVISTETSSSELAWQLQDSGTEILVCLNTLYSTYEKTGIKIGSLILTDIREYLGLITKFRDVKRKGNLNSLIITETALKEKQGIYSFKELLKDPSAALPEIEINPESDGAVLAYSSGTTTRSKGVLHTHLSLIACTTQLEAFWHELREVEEVCAAILPFANVYAQIAVMLRSLLNGSTLVLFASLDFDKILFALENHRVTSFFAVPAVYKTLLEHKKTNWVNWSRLKLIFCSADTLHDEIIKGWMHKTRTQIIEGYVLTEGLITHVMPEGQLIIGSCGIPLPNNLAAIVDPESDKFLPAGEIGELVIAGPSVMMGYWNGSDDTAVLTDSDNRRWLRTGDLGRVDEAGFFYVYDRKQDLIKVGGVSVLAREIEEVLHSHPYIKAAGVVGVVDSAKGYCVKGNVVLQTEARGKVSEEEIIAFCKERMEAYKVPTIVEFRGELPKTAVGKISRRELRDEVVS